MFSSQFFCSPLPPQSSLGHQNPTWAQLTCQHLWTNVIASPSATSETISIFLKRKWDTLVAQRAAPLHTSHIWHGMPSLIYPLAREMDPSISSVPSLMCLASQSWLGYQTSFHQTRIVLSPAHSCRTTPQSSSLALMEIVGKQKELSRCP